MFVFALMAALADSAQEADLARRLKNREPQAMEDFYDRYGKIVYSLILRVVRNGPLAEDLTQETFLRVWNRVHLLDEEQGALGSWLLTIARNRAIDHLRSADARLSQNSLELNHQDHPRLFCSMERDILNQEHARRLGAAFTKLSPNQQQVIELAYYEGLSQSEMAARMQQPLGTVKTWVRSALKTLREELGDVAPA